MGCSHIYIVELLVKSGHTINPTTFLRPAFSETTAKRFNDTQGKLGSLYGITVTDVTAFKNLLLFI